MIAILFTGIMFYAAATIFKADSNNCWSKPYPEPLDGNYEDKNYQKIASAHDLEQQKCYEAYEQSALNINNKRHILIGILSVIVLISVFFISDFIAKHGLFFGIILTNIIATIAYNNVASIIGLISLVAIFVGILIFIIRRKD
jgi:nitrate reductase gamma subunit